jgi:hypothetical protein
MQAGGHEVFQGLGGMGVFGKQADNGAGRHLVLGVRENDWTKYAYTDLKNIRKSLPNSKACRSSLCVFGGTAWNA